MSARTSGFAVAVSAMIGCDDETVRVFFLEFIRNVQKHLAPLHIRLPQTEDELAAAVSNAGGCGVIGGVGAHPLFYNR